MLQKRTNILFDQELWEQITLLAKSRKLFVGQLVKTAVKDQYALQDITIRKIKKACQAIESLRPQKKGKLDYKALINYGRKS